MKYKAIAFTLGRNRSVETPYRQFAIATINSTNGGSTIVGELAMDPAVRGMLQVWGVAVALIGLPTFIMLTNKVARGDIRWAELRRGDYRLELTVLGIMAGWGAIVLFGRGAARGQDESLKRFLMLTLEAEDQSDVEGEGE